MTLTHNLGFPRFGSKRELKHALESYWTGAIDRSELERRGRELRARHWQQQADAGLDLIPVGDFPWYDGVLDLSALLGVVPARFDHPGGEVELDTVFRMARGRAPTGADTLACEMTKWFDTNYHYIVPEFDSDQRFAISSNGLFDQVEEAQAGGWRVKPVLLGPVTYLALGKARGAEFDRLTLLERLLPVYRQVLERLAAQGVEWAQLDEPVLVTDLDPAWQEAMIRAHEQLAGCGVKRLIATYFGALGDNLGVAQRLAKEGLHIDLASAPEQLDEVVAGHAEDEVLSLGVVNGRNVWRSDLDSVVERLEPVQARLGERLWLAPSCSLLHVPLDVEPERGLDAEIKSWLAFAVQKLDEVVTLAQALDGGRQAVAEALAQARDAVSSRRRSERIHCRAVQQRLAGVDDTMKRRASAYRQRAVCQQERFGLPHFPSTTIGSFPQTGSIRAARRAYKTGDIDAESYRERMREAIAFDVRRQEQIGLDVLVHGEPERSDMVEYFGELLEGFCFTQSGWVQSFGSRGVKPPIIFGDVSRPAPMTVDWSRYAQSLTSKPLKGMLTGPVTIVQWSFVRDDQPRAVTCEQIALALRDEVQDLEAAGLKAVQIDEPAIREGMPLRRRDWPDYLAWATGAFRLASSGVDDRTQIHTHMCYSQFNDIMESVAAMDADVLTVETARSDMELLDAFARFDYPNEIGPGVYDIHSPRVPAVDEIVELLGKAAALIPAERLWVNPDCGLKTRAWEEVQPALENLVAAARIMRHQVGNKA